MTDAALRAAPQPSEVLDSLDLSRDTFAPIPAGKSTLVGRRLPDGSKLDVRVRYAVIGDKAIYQGDILLGDAETIAAKEAARNDHRFGLVITTAGEIWSDGILPWIADERAVALVEIAAAYFEQKTAIRLRRRTTEHDYVRFVSGSTNEAAVGRQGGEQVISLSPACTLGTAIHEICHALGLWHEQCRPDRDRYVTIIEQNIQLGCETQFDVQQSDSVCIGPYDYASIMHYGAKDFASTPGATTITTKGGGSIGQRVGLSSGDIRSLRSLYPGLVW